MQEEFTGLGKSLVAVGLFMVAATMLAAIMWAIPQYKVYTARQTGIATEQQATFARQVIVQQALAEKEAAQHRADAIAIVGEAAQRFPEYRQQEFIGAFAECLSNGCADMIIYVPTEAGIPITDAGRVANATK